MADKILNTRIKLKIDTLANWNAIRDTFKPLAGEVCIAEVPTVEGSTLQPVMMKIGQYTDSTKTNLKTWGELDWVSAKAADVYTWAKAATKPTYTASEITGLEEFIAGEIQDTNDNTTYAFEIVDGKLQVTETPHVLGVAGTPVVTSYDFVTPDELNTILGGYYTKSEVDEIAADALQDAKDYVDEEDVFEIDMTTINALGGIGAGSDLNGLTTHEVLKKLLYPYVDASVGNATGSPNGGTYEKGDVKTLTQVSITVTKKSEPITSVALYNGSTLIEEKNGDAVKNGGTFTFSGLDVKVPTDGNQLTVKVTYPNANGAAKTVEKKTTSLTFVYPYYMGVCADGATIDEALVEGLTKKIESKGNKIDWSFTLSNQCIVFAYPKAYGVLKSIIDPNNFEIIGSFTRHEVSITGLDGTAQAYYVYVGGAASATDFKVDFKY